ncbi:MAG: hypothetical protein HC789_13035 [Microcoleus sp. CSU_2_2]|nr:hypothetical protein [Microcoleus sp. SU_5_3]NJS11227.1 hypothetical protein [Microcoleus sp. CSU_2_2]
MNNDKYLRSMKQAIDESIKEDDKIQQFLVWLHEKTASLGSHYQEAALRAFYCDLVEGIISDHHSSTSEKASVSVNRKISRTLDSRLDKDIDESRGVGSDLSEYPYDYITYNPSTLSTIERRRLCRLISQAKTLPAVNVAFDKDVAIAWNKTYPNYSIYDSSGIKIIYLRRAIALLVRSSDGNLRDSMIYAMNTFPSTAEWGSGDIYEKRLEEWMQRLSSCLSQHRNLKLDWQFSDEQKQLLNKYYAANKLLVDLLQENRATPEVQKEIQDTLLLPIVEIERRESDINKKILLDCPLESHSIPEAKETQETLFLPTVEIAICSSNEVQQQVQNMLPSPIDEIAQYPRENKQGRPKSIKIDFYTKTLLYSSLLIALILYVVFITVLKHYIWIL